MWRIDAREGLGILFGAAGVVTFVVADGQDETMVKAAIASVVAGVFVVIGPSVISPSGGPYRHRSLRVLGLLMLIGLSIVEIVDWTNASARVEVGGLALVGVSGLLLLLEAVRLRRRGR